MNITKIEEFIVLATYLNYSKAAGKLFLTQPVLSRHIHSLEEFLGVQLFVRDTHKVLLTEAGKLCYDEFSKVLEVYNQALEKIHEYTDQFKNHISVGFLGRAARPLINGFTKKFSQDHPQIHTEYASTDLNPLIDGVHEGTFDIAYVSHISPYKAVDLEIKHLGNERLCIVAPKDSPFSRMDSVRISDLDGFPIIAFSSQTNPSAADFHQSLFKKFQTRMNVVKTVHNLDSGLFYTDMGLGVFIIPVHLRDMASALPVIPISDPEASIPMHLIWKKSNTNPGVNIFIKAFVNYVKHFKSHGNNKETPTAP